MIRKFAVLALAAAVLCGCVLQSRAPIYGDTDAALVLGPTGGIVKMSDWKNGRWVETDDERVEIGAVGKHYVVKSKTDVELHFVKLKGNWFVVQGVETGSAAVYMLAEVKDRGAEGRVLACKDLKANAAVARWITHEGDDCFVKPGTMAKELFTALLDNPGAPTFRMEIIH